MKFTFNEETTQTLSMFESMGMTFEARENYFGEFLLEPKQTTLIEDEKVIRAGIIAGRGFSGTGPSPRDAVNDLRETFQDTSSGDKCMVVKTGDEALRIFTAYRYDEQTNQARKLGQVVFAGDQRTVTFD